MKFKRLGKLSTLFLYDDNIEGLKDILLQDSVPLQCEIVRKDRSIYRTQISAIEFPYPNEQKVKFTFKWVCKLTDVRHKIGVGAQLYEKEYWTLSTDIPNNEELFTFKVYYLHKRRRLKIKGTESNYYILNPDDPARLVQREGIYEPFDPLHGSYTGKIRD